MKPHELQAIIFDVEGTLVDCVPQILESWGIALAAGGFGFSRAQLQAYSGMDGHELLQGLLPELTGEAHEQLLKAQGECYRSRFINTVQPVPHAQEVLTELSGAGFKIAIATTCQHDELSSYDRSLHCLQLANVVVCGDDVPHGKPHPDLFRSCLRKLLPLEACSVIAVGDTPYDALGAVAAGLTPLGVLTGGFSYADLEVSGCRRVFRELLEIPPYLGRTAARLALDRYGRSYD